MSQNNGNGIVEISVTRINNPARFVVSIHGHKHHLTTMEILSLSRQCRDVIGKGLIGRKVNGAEVSGDLVVQIVSKLFDVSSEAILSRRRIAESVTTARHTAMTLLGEQKNHYGDRIWSKSQVARYFNKKDHSTVVSAERRIKTLCEAYPDTFGLKVDTARKALAAATMQE